MWSAAKLEWQPSDDLIFPHQSEGLLDPNRARSYVEQFTQEFRLTSATGDFLEWIAGLYYFEKQEDAQLRRLTDVFFVGRAPAPDVFGVSLLNDASYGLADVAVGASTNSGRYGVQLFVKNVFDEFYETSGGPIDVIGIERNHTLAYTYKRRVGIAVTLRL